MTMQRYEKSKSNEAVFLPVFDLLDHETSLVKIETPINRNMTLLLVL
jgi:hypothetical protein